MARYGLLALRVLLLLAVVASAMLVAETLAQAPAFCGAGSGCALVQASAYSSIAGVPLPFVGVGAFGFLFGLSLARAPMAARSLRFALFVAAGIAIALIALQATVIDAYCPLCMTVDASAILAALVALSPRAIGAEAADPLPAWSWLGLLLLAVASPIVGASLRPPPKPPAAVEALYAREGVRVVEFADFTCPHCRALNPTLTAALRDRPRRIALARIIVPVTGHPRGPAAARAYVCATRAQRGEAMAEVLFGAGGLELPVAEWAGRVGMSPEALEGCMTSEATTAELVENAQLFDALGIEGLPTLFIDDSILLGNVDRATLDAALGELERGSTKLSVPPPVFVAIVVLLAATLIGFGLRARR